MDADFYRAVFGKIFMHRSSWREALSFFASGERCVKQTDGVTGLLREQAGGGVFMLKNQLVVRALRVYT